MNEPSATVTSIHSQQRLATGTVLAARFRIENVLGLGGMGVVYRATDLALDIPVALKLLRPELAARPDSFERFRQELLTARQVSSARVVRIHDLAQDEGQWFITMDLIEGDALDRRIDREGALPPDQAIAIARQLAEGLAAAHAKGVVHRDLKPANVLLDAQGNAYITDFGVARSLASGGLTQSGAVIGTPDYLSPEQARGEPVDGRSDLYALGLILYEMLTGAMPFTGGTIPEILAQRMMRTPPPVTQVRPETPPWIARLVDRLLRPQPAHRLQSADEVIRAIDRREVPREWRPRRNSLVLLAVVAVLALAGAAIWYTRQSAAPVAVAAVAPLHRLLVLPLEAPEEALPAPVRAALGVQTRAAFGEVPGLAIVDEERTQQGLRQLDATSTARVDIGAFRRVVGADRALHIGLARQAGQWQALATLHKEGQALTLGTATAAAPGEALDALLRIATLAEGLAIPAGALKLDLPPASALEHFGSAVLARRSDQPVEALQKFRAATQAAPGFAHGWLAQAETAAAIGEQDAALDALEHALRTATASELLQRRVRAELALLEGDAPTAAAQWRAQLQTAPDDTFAELGLARALGSGGDFAAAIGRLQKLVARDPNDPRAWFELGKFSILQGRAQAAVDEHLVRALVLYKRSGNRFGEAETVNALGIGYSRLGQIDDAEEQYRKAVELRRALGNRRGLATSLRNLGNVLSLRGEFDEAATHFQQARALHAALGDREGLAAVENDLGLLAEERGDYSAALAAFRRALRLWEQAGHKPGIAQALNDIGFAHYQLGAYDDAQSYLGKSAEAYRVLGDRTGQIRTQQNLGQLATARGQWSEARARLQASLDAAEQEQMFEEVAVSLRNLAELDLLQGHLDSSMQRAQRAETLFQQRDDSRGRVDAALLRVQALLAGRAPAQARRLLDELKPALASASAEQRAVAAQARAQLLAAAPDDAARHAQALAEARSLADASGVTVLQLQLRLQATPDARAPGLETAVVSLGNAALHLRWLEMAMQAALAEGDTAGALRYYREAQGRLRRGDFLRAEALHELGARALVASGDDSAAAIARGHARLARLTFRNRLPVALRRGFTSSPEA